MKPWTRLDQMKDDFLSRVSHELRTPMTSIRSFAELLSEAETLDTTRARRFIAIIEAESQRLTRLLDEILDLSAMESGRVEWHLARTDIGALMREAIDAMAGLAERRGVRLTLSAGTRPAHVMADPDRLKQVFLNLLSNAIKFADPPRSSVPCPRRHGRRCGVGHRRGQRAGRVAGKRAQGCSPSSAAAGVATTAIGAAAASGLAICKQIMERLGGDVTLVSTSDDGSVFRVALPAGRRRRGPQGCRHRRDRQPGWRDEPAADAGGRGRLVAAFRRQRAGAGLSGFGTRPPRARRWRAGGLRAAPSAPDRHFPARRPRHG